MVLINIKRIIRKNMDLLKGLLVKSVEETANQSNKERFDCIVIGGGTSGLLFAAVLGKAGRKVALLEAGPLALLNHINNTELRYSPELVRAVQRQFEYNSSTFDEKPYGRFISCLGGRGLFWNGAAPRFSPRDFGNWELNYEMLLPYYEKAERMFNVSTTYGNKNFTGRICKKLHECNIDAVPGPFAIDTSENKNGIIGGSIGNALGVFFKEEIWNAVDKNVEIVTSCTVNRVLLNDKSTTAEGVEVSDTNGKTATIFGKSIVLAAGAFESTRIALSSGLKESHNLIGHYISEHIFCRGYFPAPKHYYGNSPELAIVWIPATMETKSQIEIQMPGNRLFRMRNSEDWLPDESTSYAAMIRSFGSVRPTFENCITLGDLSGLGGYKVRMVYGEEDENLKHLMIQNIERTRQILDLHESTIETLPSGSSYHECGGLRMSDTLKNGVCDAYGRFHGVSNLISSDAAAWPDIPPVNPHLTLAALAYFKATQFLSHQ